MARSLVYVFDLPAFDVQAGSRLKLVFNNNDDMMHNLLVVQPGSADKVGELAIAWLLANPTVSSVIAGATKPEQVVANAKAVGWELSDDDLKEIDKIAPAA